ncbi:MAG: Uma2 family endonuclease [Leptolyngbyaceae cyanobacterium bins.59]|nr:Uma2 family endonuclease [Leptolyngbyaceae cyanobacterium bins.59]
MVVQIPIQLIQVPPGQRILLHCIDWDTFEAVLEELGEQRSTKIAYDRGVLEIMAPLPIHEFDKEIISDLLKAFLEELEIEFLTLGSTTFKNKAMLQGIEPDQCFYIQNELRVRGKNRLDLAIDPPPDLALEVDVTSRTHPGIYAALGVPELWRRDNHLIRVYVLQTGEYVEVDDSPTAPGWQLASVIPQYVEQSRAIGRNKTMRAFRTWVRAELEKRG